MDKTPTPTTPCEIVADKGYHSRGVLKDLDDGPWKSRIAERRPNGLNWWNGDKAARRAVYNNRARIASGVGRQAARLRTELVERSFEHTLDRGGGMRRAWLRGRENVEKRSLIHVAGFNLSLLLRNKYGQGTPKGAVWAVFMRVIGLHGSEMAHVLLIMNSDDQLQWKLVGAGVVKRG